MKINNLDRKTFALKVKTNFIISIKKKALGKFSNWRRQKMKIINN